MTILPMLPMLPIEVINYIVEIAELGIKYIYNESTKKYETKINPRSIKCSTLDNLYGNCIFLFYSREQYTIFGRTIEYKNAEICIHTGDGNRKYKKVLYCTLLREISRMNCILG